MPRVKSNWIRAKFCMRVNAILSARESFFECMCFLLGNVPLEIMDCVDD